MGTGEESVKGMYIRKPGALAGQKPMDASQNCPSKQGFGQELLLLYLNWGISLLETLCVAYRKGPIQKNSLVAS